MIGEKQKNGNQVGNIQYRINTIMYEIEVCKYLYLYINENLISDNLQTLKI